MSEKIEYHAFMQEYTRYMAGDREEVTATGGEGTEVGWFKDRSQAETEALRWLADETAKANKAASGIGSITYSEVEVERFAYDDDYGDWLPCSPDGAALDNFADSCVLRKDNLTPALEKAWSEAKASYYAFLDYEAEGFYTVSERLEINDRLPADLASLGATRRSPESEAIRDVAAEAREAGSRTDPSVVRAAAKSAASKSQHQKPISQRGHRQS